MTISTLLNTTDRNKRVLEKRRIVLRFLRDETWTHISILMILLEFKTVQAVYQTLKKMERDNLIKRAEIKMNYGRPTTIWGITEIGLNFSYDIDEPLQKRKTFEPSKVRPLVMQHKIDLQLTRIQAEKNGWTNWIPGELLGRRIASAKYPDAVTTNQQDEIIAIELERTIKSRKRYAEILVSHLMQRKNGHWNKIYYLSPDADLAARIKRAFYSIEQAKYNSKRFNVTAEHLKPFHFYSFNENDWL